MDVVNEVFNDDDGTFRNCVFYNVLGESCIDLGFQAAHAADPETNLYINDFNLDGAGPKVDAMLALVEQLQSRGSLSMVPGHRVI
ncbi:glycoside hydrolase superfamily [Trichophaea hybrida]|nr:glycoside hydrolase superfamily [Trichophaea hybrida]